MDRDKDNLVSIIIWQSGEPYIEYIISQLFNQYKVIKMYRFKTDSQSSFFEKMSYIYQEIDPSNAKKVHPKIRSQNDSTSFLLIVCRGDSSKNLVFKNKIRKFTGLNCLHTSDSTHTTLLTLKYLLGKNHPDVHEFITSPSTEINYSSIQNFSSEKFECIETNNRVVFSSISEAFRKLNSDNHNYVVIDFIDSLKDLRPKSDLEILTTDIAKTVDILNLDYHKSTTVYKLRINGVEIKLDFYYSISLPLFWTNHILANKSRSINGYYEARDVDKFWVTIYDRSILKPYKFKNEDRYANGGIGWASLIEWGNNIGIYPRFKGTESILFYKYYLKKYLKKIGNRANFRDKRLFSGVFSDTFMFYKSRIVNFIKTKIR